MNLTAIKNLSEINLTGAVKFELTTEDKNFKELRITDEKDNFIIVKPASSYSETLKILIPKFEDRWLLSGDFLGVAKIEEYFDDEYSAERRLEEYQAKTVNDTGLAISKVTVKSNEQIVKTDDEIPF